MANLGASVGGVADSFLKAFTTLNNDYRANEEAERLKAALALEQAQAEQERQAVAEWIAAQQANKTQKAGFLETPTGKPVNSNLKAFEMTLPAGTPDAQVNQVAAGLANKQIPIPQGGGQFGMMSDQNDLKDLYMKLAAVNPRKYLNLLQKDDSGYDKLMAMMLIAQMRQNQGTQGANPVEKPPSGYRFTGDGGLKPIPGGPADKSGKMSDQDKVVFKGIFKNLTTAEDKAVESIPKIKQLDTMIQSLEKGDVGGFEGGLKAFAAPIAGAIGLDKNEKYGEAQAFKLMSRAFVAGMRLKLIGPGPMSDAEQKLLSQLSGGDITTSRRAARDLLQMYRDMAANDIKQYHAKYDFYKQKNPKVADAFMRFDDVVGDDSSAETKPTGQKDISTAVNFVHGAKTKEDAKARYKQLLDPSKKWSKEELKKISDSIEYSRWK